MPDDNLPNTHVLEELYRVILSRRGADPTQSNTAKLFAKGKKKIAQKLGEEAVEALIEGVRGDREGLIAESADLLYHLVVLWASAGVNPKDVWDEMDRRERLLGVAEKLPKAAREYLDFVEKESGAQIGMVSTGPGREETIFIDEFTRHLESKPGNLRRAQG